MFLPKIKEDLPAFPIASSLNPIFSCIIAASTAIPAIAVDVVPNCACKVPKAFITLSELIAISPDARAASAISVLNL